MVVDSLQTGQKFKDTEIGKIPVDWELSKLREQTSVITKGSTPTTYGYEYVGKGVKFLRVENVNENTTVDLKDVKFIDEETNDFLKRSQLKEDDLLFSIAGAIGRVGIISENILPANINQALAIIRLKNSRVDKQFLKYVLISNITQKQTKLSTVQLAQMNLSLEQVGRIVIPLPKIGEQEKIADILKNVDDAIEKSDQVIEKTKQLKKGLMQQLLTRGIGHKKFKKTELGEIPEMWEVVNLLDHLDVMTDFVANGSFQSLRENVHVTEKKDFAIYVRLFDLRLGLGHKAQKYLDENSYKFLSKSALFGREILIANIGANVGEVFLMPILEQLASIAPNMIVLKLNKNSNSEFLYYFLSSNFGQNMISVAIAGSGQPKLNKTDLKKVRVIMPPLDEQIAIGEVFQTIDDQFKVELDKKENMKTIKYGLMQVLLTGKRRVRI